MKLKQLLLLVLLLITTCLLGFSAISQTTTNLLAHYKLDGNTNNLGPANAPATAVGTSYTTNNANAANRALQFGGTLSSYIDFVDNSNFDFAGATNFTVSFSFYFNGSATSGLIDNCLNYGGWGIWLWSTVTNVWNLQFNYRNNSVGSAAATNFTIGVWHHVAAVRNNGTISLYIDGVFRLSATEGTQTPTYPINTVAGAMGYGSFSPPRYNPFGGKIDEIRIYNRALTAGEIAILTPFSLPLKLGDFNAYKKQNGIQLDWETLTEENTSHFEVERSENGTNFTKIGNVNAAGNSSDKKSYSFLDITAANTTQFYRLRMVDLDGTATYSRVVVIKTSGHLQLQLFPNPVSEILQVQIPSRKKETIQMLISDASGKLIYTKTMQLNDGQNATSIPVLHFAPGTYQLTINNSEGRQTRTFIRQ